MRLRRVRRRRRRRTGPGDAVAGLRAAGRRRRRRRGAVRAPGRRRVGRAGPRAIRSERRRRSAQALDLWAGDAYAEFDGEGWVMPEAQRLAELRSVTEEQLVDAELACGLAAELVSRLEVLVGRRNRCESRSGPPDGGAVPQRPAGRRAGGHARLPGRAGRRPGWIRHRELEELAQRILAHDEELRQVEPPGRVVRGYRLGERLGSGRDGTVHAARLPGVDRDLVIRVVPPGRRRPARRRAVVRRDHAAGRGTAPRRDRARSTTTGASPAAPGSCCAGCVAGPCVTGSIAARCRPRTSRPGRAGRARPWRPRRDLGVVHGRVIPESVLFDEAGAAHLADFPLGEVDGDPGDDVVAFARLVHEALTGTRRDVGDGVPVTAPGRRRRCDDAMSADPPPPIARLLADFDATAAGATARRRPVGNPYKGLRAFDEADAADFFGRDTLVAGLVDRLGAARTGRPARAGRGGVGQWQVERRPRRACCRGSAPGAIAGSDAWLVTTMIPGAAPFKELAEGLARVATASRGPRRRPLGAPCLPSDLAGATAGSPPCCANSCPTAASAAGRGPARGAVHAGRRRRPARLPRRARARR